MADDAVKDSDLRVELKFSTISLQHETTCATVFEMLVKQVGRHLSYLSVSHSNIGRSKTLVATILKHCVNVEHLALVSVCLKNQHLNKLLEGLRGDLGDRLKTLNLRDSGASDGVYQKFADLLANPERIPALQELRQEFRLSMRFSAETALPAYRNILLVNKTS